MRTTHFLGLAMGFAAAHAEQADTESYVVQLMEDSFEDFVTSNALVLAEFYAPWCGHCKALAPEYERAAEMLKDEDIFLAQIDCTENQELCHSYQIQGYPTMKVFRGLDSVTNYDGARSADAITKYMRRKALPAVVALEDAVIDDFVGKDDVTAVAFFNDVETNKTLQQAAERFRERLMIGASSDAKLAAKYGAKLPSLVIFKKDEEPVVMNDLSKATVESLSNFINTESLLTFGEIGPDNFNAYVESRIPVMFVLVDNPEQRTTIKKLLEPHITDLKGKASIAFLNATLYGSYADALNIKREFPALVIQDMALNRKYPHSQDDEITSASVSDFVKLYVSGEMSPVFKSAPVPEEQVGPVFVLVGSEYDKIVLDDDKDVLVEFYAPWCGHCKNLAPTYEELAELYGDNDSVIIAKIDHTENEVPDVIQGYPTIKLYPAGKKNAPVLFEGQRTVEALAEFIEEHGGKKAAPQKAPAAGKDEKAADKKKAHDEL